MNHPEIIMILARGENGVIGLNGTMPWHISADLRRFKRLTKGCPMIMGRKTFDSLPALLEGRRHIVLTHDPLWQEEGAEVAHGVEEALRIANAPHVFVIGGAEIYRLFEPKADRIELTEVALAPKGDAFADAFDTNRWRVVSREEHTAEGDTPAFTFVSMVRE